MKNVKLYVGRNKGRIMQVVCALLICAGMAVTQAFAAGGLAAVEGLTQLKSAALKIVTGIGAIIAIYGGISLGLGFAQDNPDGQSRGIKFVIGGALMVAVSTIVGWFGV